MAGAGALALGREAYANERWSDAYEALDAADRAEELGPSDLEQLATAAYMLGRGDVYIRSLERAYRAHLDSGASRPGARCAFWIGITLAQRGELGGAGGWLGRAQRLVEREDTDCVEAGYLLLPLVFQQEAEGALEAAAGTAAEAAGVGDRFRDPDLVALAAHERGHLLIRLGRVGEGLALLDESMVAATAGELSPIVCGIVYCGSILACRDAYELRRSQEWTAALADWCARQPDLVAFTGRCLTHRAQVLRLRGDWPHALEEAKRATQRCLDGENPGAAGEACYERGEVHRLRGDFRAAEEAYREASGRGFEPQPGLALLRLAQGKADAAAAAIRRLDGEASEPARRARVQPAYVEIMLAIDELEAADSAARKLESLAVGHQEGALEALAAEARGAVQLATGDARSALPPLRRALQIWQGLEAPYDAARLRELLGQACRELGDEDSARLELDAAREGFAELGARVDLARAELLLGISQAAATHGLTARELEVLRLVAAGMSNREVAAELVISEHTAARHLQNIFAKLGVSSRTAASAFAFEHHLV